MRRLEERGRGSGRSDDEEDTIRHRIEVYEEKTLPLLDYYKERGILVRVDAVGGLLRRGLPGLAGRVIVRWTGSEWYGPQGASRYRCRRDLPDPLIRQAPDRAQHAGNAVFASR
jgi:hypothetical protein